jgi:hypothetical protein
MRGQHLSTANHMTTTDGVRMTGALGRIAAAELDIVPVIVPAPEGDGMIPLVRSEELARPGGQMRRWLAAQGARGALPSPTDTPYV